MYAHKRGVLITLTRRLSHGKNLNQRYTILATNAATKTKQKTYEIETQEKC